MGVSRRSVLQIGLLAISGTALVYGQQTSRPNPAQLQAGDFLWPKSPNAQVLYHSGDLDSPERAQERWVRERDAYVAKIEANPSATFVERARAITLRAMSYREFMARYLSDEDAAGVQPFGGGSIYVGHVAIVHVASDKSVWVIEALMDKGVVRTAYDEWLRGRADQLVWQGRLADQPPEARSTVATQAQTFIGRPYDFWNFDLGDDKTFYCSKLCWLCVFRALRMALDGNPATERTLWYSPKQMLKGRSITKLHVPAEY